MVRTRICPKLITTCSHSVAAMMINTGLISGMLDVARRTYSEVVADITGIPF